MRGNVPPRCRPQSGAERSAAQGRAERVALQRPLGLGSGEAAAPKPPGAAGGTLSPGKCRGASLCLRALLKGRVGRPGLRI